MKNLSKDDLAARDELAAAYRDAVGEANKVVAEINELIEKLNVRIEAVNSITGRVNWLAEGVSQRMADYYGERSEKWRASDAGSAYSDWQGEWGDFAAEEIEPRDELDEIEDQVAEALEGLPTEPST